MPYTVVKLQEDAGIIREDLRRTYEWARESETGRCSSTSTKINVLSCTSQEKKSTRSSNRESNFEGLRGREGHMSYHAQCESDESVE